MLKAYFNAIKDILFPRLCFYCGKKITHGYLCQGCEEKIEFLSPPLCRLCSTPINRDLRHRNFNNFLRQEIPMPCRGFGGLQAIPQGVTAEEMRISKHCRSVIGAIAPREGRCPNGGSRPMNKLASVSEPNLTNICKNCIKKSVDYTKLVSIMAYKEPLIRLIHLFKYKDCDYLAEYFAALMIKHLSKINFSLLGYNLITSIPVHRQTYKKRGYNQAELIGEKIANYFKIPFKNDIIYKNKFKPSQVKLPKEKRENNIKDTFTVKNNLLTHNIIIIDDVFTTGATIRECASTLKKKGADNILAITLAKTMSS